MGNKYLFTRIFFSFAFGILLAEYFSFHLTHLIFLPVIVIVLLSIKYLTKNKPLFNSLLLSALLVFMGIGNYLIHSNRNAENVNHDSLFNRKIMLKGVISEIDCFKESKIKFILSYDQVRLESHSIPIKNSCLVEITSFTSPELSLDFFKSIVKIGNTIQIEGYHTKPRGQLYPGDFDYLKYLEWKNVNGLLRSNEFSRLDLLEHHKNKFSLRNLVSDLRQRLIQQIDRNFESNSAFLLRGLLVGDRSEIPSDVKTNFVNSGVAHVLAVSGLHTGYILIILVALSGRFNKYIQLILVSLGLLFFVLITNASPSVIRASIMAVLWLISKILQRKSNLLNTISIAGIIILIIRPEDFFNPGFQLSFGAVLSIAIVYPLFKALKEKVISIIPRFPLSHSIIDLFLVSLAVQIGTLPFVIGYYEKLSIIALVANIFVIPLIGVILAAGILSIITFNIFPLIFFIYEKATTVLVYLALNIIKVFGEVSFAYITVNNFSLMNALIYFVFLGLLIYHLQSIKSLVFKTFLTVSVIAAYFIYFPIFQQQHLSQDKSYLIVTDTKNISSLCLIDPSQSVIRIRKIIDAPLSKEMMSEIIKNISVNERLINDKIQSKIFEGFTHDEIGTINSDLEFDLKFAHSENKKNLTFSPLITSNTISVNNRISTENIHLQISHTDHTWNKYLVETKDGIVCISNQNSFPKNSAQIFQGISNYTNKIFIWVYSDIGIDSLKLFNSNADAQIFSFQTSSEDIHQIRRIMGTRVFQITKDNIEEVNWRKI